VKTLVTLASLVLVAGGLAGCAADSVEPLETEAQTSAGSECTPSGDEVESISVEGAVGDVPRVSFETPLSVSSTQRVVVFEGEGEPVENGDDLVVDYSLYNAATGAVIEESRATRG
jgi:peptidylprolyl isomerase